MDIESTVSSGGLKGKTDLIVEILREIIDLESLGLKSREVDEVALTIVERLSIEEVDEVNLRRTINSNINTIKSIISEYILEVKDKLSDEQLDYVVFEGGEATLKHISKVYREVTRSRRGDLIPVLRLNWALSHYKTLITCPKCGFQSITPEFKCIVCGEMISYKEALDSIGGVQTLVIQAEVNGPRWISEIMRKREFYYSAEGITLNKPREERLYYKFRLGELEVEELKKMLKHLRGRAEDG